MSCYVAKQKHVSAVAAFVWGGSTHFYLSYVPEQNDPSYALLVVNVDDPEI